MRWLLISPPKIDLPLKSVRKREECIHELHNGRNPFDGSNAEGSPRKKILAAVGRGFEALSVIEITIGAAPVYKWRWFGSQTTWEGRVYSPLEIPMELYPFLRHLMLGPVTSFRNISFVGVFGPDALAEEPQPLLLDEAMRTGYLTVTDSGHVSRLEVENRLGVRVFVASGAIVEGNTQNRASQYPVMIPSRTRGIKLSVKCVEQGHPVHRLTRFDPSETILVASARTGCVDQDRTWATIGGTIGSLGTVNATNDYATAVKASSLEDYYERVAGEPKKGQLGYVAAINSGDDISFYADIFGSQQLYRRLYQRLVESVAAVAKAASESESQVLHMRKSNFASFLFSAAKSHLNEQPLDDKLAGTVYVADEPVAISTLAYHGKTVQLSVRKDLPYSPSFSRSPDNTIMFRSLF